MTRHDLFLLAWAACLLAIGGQPMNPLAGKKTYIVALGLTLVSLGEFIQGALSLGELAVGVLTALGLATLRLGVATDTKK